LFIKNNSYGGGGNDLLLDDIALNPTVTPLPNITVSPTIAPNICIGTNYTFSNSQSGGIWSASPSSVALINAKTGKARGVGAGLAVINYTYTNAIGCVLKKTTAINVTGPPTVTVSDLLGGTSCLNQVDSLYSSATGGTSPYTYQWAAAPASGSGLGNANIQNTTALPTTAGNYNYLALVTDAVGCVASNSVTIAASGNTAPTVSASATGPYCTNASFALNSSATGGSGAYTYTWSASQAGNGLGATATANTTATPTSKKSYTYQVSVNDGFCTVPAFVNVDVNNTPAVNSSVSGTTNICAGGTISLTSTPSGGTQPYTYLWSGSTTPTSNGGLLATGVQSPSAKPAAGSYTYTVKVTDANGCNATSSSNASVSYSGATSIFVQASLSPASTTICSGSTITLDATVTNGGTPNFTYVWSGGPGVVSNASSGSTSSTTYNGATVSTNSINTTTTGSYTLTVTDGAGCVFAVNTPTITINPSPSVAANYFGSALCTSGTDSVYAIPSGGTLPYTFAWAVSPATGGIAAVSPTNDTTAITGGTLGNTYTFTVTTTDANGCTATDNTAIALLNANGPTINGMPAANGLCINTTNVLAATVSAGSAPISTYSWSATPSGNGLAAANSATVNVTPTTAGSFTYTLNVTDANGCTASASAGVQTVGSPVSVVVAASGAGFCGASSNLELVAAATGGSGNYANYTWSTTTIAGPGTTTVSPVSASTTPATTASVSANVIPNVSQFQYSAVVTDDNGCVGNGQSNVLVVGNTLSLSTPTVTIPSLCTGQTFSLTANFSGGSSPYAYSWTGPGNVTITPASATTTALTETSNAVATHTGTYSFSLLLQDANSCIASGTTTAVIIDTVPNISVSSSDYIVCATPAQTINLTGVLTYATTAPYTYAWTGSGVVNNTSNITTTANPTATSAYTVTVTDANGCAATANTATVFYDPAAPDITLTCGINGTGDSYAQFYEANGISWLWTTTSGGRFFTSSALNDVTRLVTSNLQAPFVKFAGDYAVQISDANGCSGTGTYTITNTSCQVVLSATGLDFKVQKQGQKAQLIWTTLSESNTSHFDIERSNDATNWQPVGTVKASGNTTRPTKYSFVDGLPLEGINYYRIKLVNNDGVIAYSPIKSLSFIGQWMVKLYPNPVQNQLWLEFNNDRNEKAAILVQDMLGNTVLTAENQLVKGHNLITINQLPQLAKGTYVITMITNENIFRSTFIKGGY